MNILNQKQIKDIKVCGRILKAALLEATKLVDIGVTAYELDQTAERFLLKHGAKPSFKGYRVDGFGIYPSTLCVSINSDIVHGLPLKDKILRNGDIVSLDIGAEYKGVCTDMAVTLPVGNISKDAQKLLTVTKESLNIGIKNAKRHGHIGDIGHAIQRYVEINNFNVIRDLVGHGIGTKPHMDPQIPNYGRSGSGPEILEGMALAIEPMVAIGSYETEYGDDGWAIKTYDDSIVAHFEHTVIIENGKTITVTA